MLWLDKVFSFISEPVTQWLKNRGELKMAKHAFRLAELENKTRLMLSQQEYNRMWEMEALKSTGKGLKWACFLMLALPMLLTMGAPYTGFDAAAMWAAFNMIPVFWQNLWLAANATIWGTLQINDLGGFSKIKEVLENRPSKKAVSTAKREIETELREDGFKWAKE